MPYIGRDTDKISNVEVLDNITFDGSSSYTLQKGGSNFTPSSANTLLLSIDGVVQAGNFTVSGSTIDFGTAVAGTSTCDFVLHYGIGLITTVSDGTVTTAKLGDSSVTTAKLNDSAVTTAKLNDASVSLAKLTATGTKSSSTFLRGDNTFAEAGGGAMELLHTATGANVSSIDINGYFTSDYDHYKLIYSVYAATANTDTMVRIMQGGSVITASNYWFVGNAWYYDGTYSQESQAVGFNTNYIGISSADNTADSQYPTTGEMLLSNPLSTSQNTTITTNSIGYNSVSPPTAIRTWNYTATYVSTTATSGISFGYIGGNIHGTIRLYGMKNS
jgi:hypothetical protein